jgi:predicted dehydrogenase
MVSSQTTTLMIDRPYSFRMIDPALGGGSLLDLGPYPAVWAMMLLHHHPDSTRQPKMLFHHQTVYERSGVDANSRWLIEWEGVGQALCVTDMTAFGIHLGCVVVTCDKGDLVIEGE